MTELIKISCHVSAEKILRAEADYHDAIKRIASLKRNELNEKSLLKKYRVFLIWCLYITCVIGIALTILILLPMGTCKADYLFTIAMLVFFVAIILIFKNEQKISNAIWGKINNFISESRTEHMFKIARRLVPFEANYYFSGKMLTYVRQKDGNETTNWSKPISGQYYAGKDFIVTYKKKALYPDLFMFIDTPDSTVEHLNQMGLFAIPL
jgi:hypothetical protein